MSIQHVSKLDDYTATLKTAMERGVPTFIKFTATWCGPCKMMAPVFKKCAETYVDSALFLEVDVDDAPELATRFEVNAMPTFVVVNKRGKVAEKLVGASKSKLEALIDTHVDTNQ